MNLRPGWFAALLVVPRVLLFAAYLLHPETAVKTDSAHYLVIARNMIQHHAFSASTAPPYIPDISRTPGYPLFLFPFAALFASPIPWIIGIQMLLSALTSVLLWRWATPWSGRRGALGAALVLGCDWVTLAHSGMMLTETLFIFFFTLALMQTWDALEKNPERSGIAGLLWGISALIRPVVVYLPFLLTALWFRKKKWGIVFLAASYLLPGLWVLRNYHAGHFAGYTSIDGYALLMYPAAGAEAIRLKEPIGSVRARLLKEAAATLPAGAKDVDVRNAYKTKADDVLRHAKWELLVFNAHGAARILGGTGLEMLTDLLGWARTQAGAGSAFINMQGTLSLLRTHPVLIPLQIAYVLFLAWLYWAFFLGLRALWVGSHRSVAALLAVVFLYILAISSHQGYYRFRIPLVPVMAIAVAAYLSASAREYKKRFLSDYHCD